ncbi:MULTISPECIES: MarR family winged helix-turn-helix transcriptional regulator [Acinetobacter]|uniref:MarR family winged helix-turn-helix transcriptional regulator n=1 Tax=Acinetobacter TaxID=469 RepID=UPI00101F5CA3|nr:MULTISPECIES: MarR family transcriptional regulator [Acinetobacter]RYL22776.1 MarR family transcriptional regulator [Acinetobacter piscicola]
MKTQSTLELDRYIPALITFFSNKMSLGSSQIYAQLFQINIIEWRILSMLAVEPNISARRISQVIGLDKSAVSRAIAKLKTQEYIDIKEDKRDARATKICLTAQGVRLHDEIFKVAIDREKVIFDVLSTEDKEHLIRIMTQLNAHILDANEQLNEKYLNP